MSSREYLPERTISLAKIISRILRRGVRLLRSWAESMSLRATCCVMVLAPLTASPSLNT